MDVHVEEIRYGNTYIYHVWVDGRIYDSMTLLRGYSLTWTEQADMASYYKEALSEAL